MIYIRHAESNLIRRLTMYNAARPIASGRRMRPIGPPVRYAMGGSHVFNMLGENIRMRV